jgi:hypothetical protein
MLAMVANDNAGNLTPRGVLGFIASLLAPTDYSARTREKNAVISS